MNVPLASYPEVIHVYVCGGGGVTSLIPLCPREGVEVTSPTSLRGEGGHQPYTYIQYGLPGLCEGDLGGGRGEGGQGPSSYWVASTHVRVCTP